MRESSPIQPLIVLYEDEWMIAVDKPAGQMVHPADVPSEGDQVTMKILRDQIGGYVYPIHRLDRPTTGVLLFAKNPSSAALLQQALERREFSKTYLAVVHGAPPADNWECEEPLRKTETAVLKDAHTSFRTMRSVGHARLSTLEEENAVLSLIEAIPHTGRYHQIRRHLLHCGIPIAGDYRYAGISESDALGELLGTGTRMLLQAKNLSITHPFTEEKLSISVPTDRLILQCFPDVRGLIEC